MGSAPDRALRLVEQFKGEGCERRLGMAISGERWATAGTGVVHLWRGLSLDTTVAAPGHVDGAPAFDERGTVRVGRFVVGEPTSVTYLEASTELLSTGLDHPAADFAERFVPRRVEWSPDGSAAIVVATYRKPRERAGTVPEPPSPPDRLLLVDGDWSQLLAVIDPALDEDDPLDIAATNGFVALAGPKPRIVSSRSGAAVTLLPPDIAWEAVAWAGEGSRVALAGEGEAALCTEDGSPLRRWPTGVSASGQVRVAVDATGTHVAVAARTSVSVWSDQGELLGRQDVEGDIDDVAFSMAGDLYVAMGPPTRVVAIYSVEP